MILVDTSVWVDHLRTGTPQLSHLLNTAQVFMHPMIIGELACGHLHNRNSLIGLWQNLPSITEASHAETLLLLNAHGLMGKGIGFIDLHLLAATLLTSGTLLWTTDKRLNAIAQQRSVSFTRH